MSRSVGGGGASHRGMEEEDADPHVAGGPFHVVKGVKGATCVAPFDPHVADGPFHEKYLYEADPFKRGNCIRRDEALRDEALRASGALRDALQREPVRASGDEPLSASEARDVSIRQHTSAYVSIRQHTTGTSIKRDAALRASGARDVCAGGAQGRGGGGSGGQRKRRGVHGAAQDGDPQFVKRAPQYDPQYVKRAPQYDPQRDLQYDRQKALQYDPQCAKIDPQYVKRGLQYVKRERGPGGGRALTGNFSGYYGQRRASAKVCSKTK